ncbi:hypothetical protein T439DRAFT_321877 [Meredithblackwellia eburnea MCA 4105]
MARGGFDVRQVFSHPAFLITLLLAVVGWFTAFVGQVILEAKYHSLNGKGSAVGVAWFGIFLQLFLIIGVFYTLATDSVAVHRFQLSLFLAIAVVFAVWGTNAGIYNETSFQLAMGAGWLILSVVDILWLLHFSADEDSFQVHMWNSGASTSFARGSGRRNTRNGSSNLGISGGMGSSGGGISYQNPYSGVGSKAGMSGMGGPAGLSVNDLHNAQDNNARSPTIGGASMMEGQGSQQDYILKAKALYSYSASPDDPNEISFTKGDILDIVDNSGKWWQARKSDGTKGIVPSNYLTILPS